MLHERVSGVDGFLVRPTKVLRCFGCENLGRAGLEQFVHVGVLRRAPLVARLAVEFLVAGKECIFDEFGSCLLGWRALVFSFRLNLGFLRNGKI